MARIPEQFIDELLARTDIVDVVESRVPLQRAGREFRARCPFHDERTPSFWVSPTKQFYHCFGCGVHGSAIKFLMEYDRVEFIDAVEDLAGRVGLKVPYEQRPGRTPERDFGDLYEVLDAAARFFQQQLPKSDKAKAYLDKRRIDPAMVERFQIGYAPDSWDALKQALGARAGGGKLLDQAGLSSSNDQGRSYDKFRDRLMFPIQDRRSRVIAFGGRVLDPEASPKYLNSPETALFQKGRELYALNQVRLAHSKISRLIVVEGYVDVIALFQFGITQAVATLGTATTRDHAELLFRNAADVYFCFDGDRAGRSAAWRAVENVLPRMRDGRQAHFLFLPDGEDPDTLIRKEGAHGFEERLKSAAPLSEFFFAHQEVETDLGTADGRARLAEKCKSMIAGIPEGAFRDRMQEMLIEKSTIRWNLPSSLGGVREKAESMLDDRVAAMRATANPQAAAPVVRKQSDRHPVRLSVIRSAIALLLQKPQLALAIEPPYLFSELRQPGVRLFVEMLSIVRARPEITSALLLETLSEREEGEALRKLALMDFPAAPEHWQAEFNDALSSLDRQTRQQRLADLTKRQSEVGWVGMSDVEKIELRELHRLLGRLNG
ncbi:DNA primase [Ahniella affigens]|uniref:DNA primase n=1 Tax=Ahniella affigens TaxID=2021234 RepID=A0A2P1PZ37_9GAMM|nr:DNA primase [Ahniella affigens]AVQ00110.1 DNA primase [Ahniella affigens]